MRKCASAGSADTSASPVSDLTSSATTRSSRAEHRGALGLGCRCLLDLILGADDDDTRLVLAGLVLGHRRIGADDQLVTNAGFARGRTVEADHSRAGLAFDHIRREAFAVIDIVDLDPL